MFKGLGNFGDMAKMMKAAQDMQGKMAQIQEDLSAMRDHGRIGRRPREGHGDRQRRSHRAGHRSVDLQSRREGSCGGPDHGGDQGRAGKARRSAPRRTKCARSPTRWACPPDMMSCLSRTLCRREGDRRAKPKGRRPSLPVQVRDSTKHDPPQRPHRGADRAHGAAAGARPALRPSRGAPSRSASAVTAVRSPWPTRCSAVARDARECLNCGNVGTSDVCTICAERRRAATGMLCIVEDVGRSVGDGARQACSRAATMCLAERCRHWTGSNPPTLRIPAARAAGSRQRKFRK